VGETFSPESLATEFQSVTKEYVPKKIEEIKRIIREAFSRRVSGVWIKFLWEDGDYDEIIQYFEQCGFSVGSPTGPEGSPETSYYFSWKRNLSL